MSWFSRKRKNHYIAVITKYNEREPLKNTICLCIELDNLVKAKNLILNQIRVNILIDHAPAMEDDPDGQKTERCIKALHFEANGETLHGENALQAIGEALIPSSSFETAKERDDYYENFVSTSLSFCTIDDHMMRSVYGVFLRLRRDGEA